MKKILPKIAVTLGDPAGIGPEVVVGALADSRIHKQIAPLIIGHEAIVRPLLKRWNLSLEKVNNIRDWRPKLGKLSLYEPPKVQAEKIKLGVPSAVTGRLSAEYVRVSAQLALDGFVDGVAHAPIAKSAWKMAGVCYPGHTEWLGDLCRVKNYGMAIASGNLRTVLVTRHIPLKEVAQSLTARDVTLALELAASWAGSLGLRQPRIALCALNPHAGESGLIGSEEIKILRPVLDRFLRRKNKKGVRFSGPFPADSAYRDLRNGAHHILVTLYHDQSLIPLKLWNDKELINITLGLPFARTSPGHGTAFDIAGKKQSDSSAMKAAIQECAKMIRGHCH